jgi:hypothetical protein
VKGGLEILRPFGAQNDKKEAGPRMTKRGVESRMTKKEECKFKITASAIATPKGVDYIFM